VWRLVAAGTDDRGVRRQARPHVGQGSTRMHDCLEVPARSDGEHTAAGARAERETWRRAKRRQRWRAGPGAHTGRERNVRRDSRTGSGNGGTRARSGDGDARRPTTRGKFW
jgi:hypothetical protein